MKSIRGCQVTEPIAFLNSLERNFERIRAETDDQCEVPHWFRREFRCKIVILFDRSASFALWGYPALIADAMVGDSISGMEAKQRGGRVPPSRPIGSRRPLRVDLWVSTPH